MSLKNITILIAFISIYTLSFVALVALSNNDSITSITKSIFPNENKIYNKMIILGGDDKIVKSLQDESYKGGYLKKDHLNQIVSYGKDSNNKADPTSSDVTQLKKRIEDLERRLKTFPEVPRLNYKERKRILVVGGAGFVGSHLVDRLMMIGHEVAVADNFFTGRKRNIEHWIGHPNFDLITHDIVNPLYIEVDEIYHLASPASPPHYMYNPVKTVKTNTLGTINLLGLAKRVKARILLASTSEVYGDPSVHPQSEDYWGNVNTIGPRACYDEGKRVAETLCYAYARQDKVDVRVARIFNTYGPRMHMNDGRVVSNIILQVLQNESITIYGKGEQTRSFQYVSDLVNGLVSLMNSNYTYPVNLGNPIEITILEFAEFVKSLIPKSTSKLEYKGALQDDPQRRCPDISRAKKELDWEPKIALKSGILKTVKYFAKELRLNGYETLEETSEGYIEDYVDFLQLNMTNSNLSHDMIDIPNSINTAHL